MNQKTAGIGAGIAITLLLSSVFSVRRFQKAEFLKVAYLSSLKLTYHV